MSRTHETGRKHVTNGHPTGTLDVALNMAEGDFSKARAIHKELEGFVTRMAMNDHKEFSADHYKEIVDGIKDHSAAEIKEIVNS